MQDRMLFYMQRRAQELSRSEIVAAALALADADGVSALTMRELAKRLRCAPMAIYRHVDNKDALIRLVADDVLGRLESVRADVPWQHAMTEFFTAFRAALLEHPCVAEIMATQPIATHQTLHHAERAIAVLCGAGLADQVAVEAFIALAQYTLGASLPGTSQALYQAWAALEDSFVPGELPTLARAGRYFVTACADERFTAGLNNLVSAYQAGAVSSLAPAVSP